MQFQFDPELISVIQLDLFESIRLAMSSDASLTLKPAALDTSDGDDDATTLAFLLSLFLTKVTFPGAEWEGHGDLGWFTDVLRSSSRNTFARIEAEERKAEDRRAEAKAAASRAQSRGEAPEGALLPDPTDPAWQPYFAAEAAWQKEYEAALAAIEDREKTPIAHVSDIWTALFSDTDEALFLLSVGFPATWSRIGQAILLDELRAGNAASRWSHLELARLFKQMCHLPDSDEKVEWDFVVAYRLVSSMLESPELSPEVLVELANISHRLITYAPELDFGVLGWRVAALFEVEAEIDSGAFWATTLGKVIANPNYPSVAEIKGSPDTLRGIEWSGPFALKVIASGWTNMEELFEVSTTMAEETLSLGNRVPDEQYAYLYQDPERDGFESPNTWLVLAGYASARGSAPLTTNRRDDSGLNRKAQAEVEAMVVDPDLQNAIRAFISVYREEEKAGREHELAEIENQLEFQLQQVWRAMGEDAREHLIDAQLMMTQRAKGAAIEFAKCVEAAAHRWASPQGKTVFQSGLARAARDEGFQRIVRDRLNESAGARYQ